MGKGGGNRCDVIWEGGGLLIVTVCDGGVQNSLNLRDVIYERLNTA